MKINQIPAMNMDMSETGCCPRFDPTGWDGQEIIFDKKLFVKVKTRSFFHIPVNMGPVFTRVMQHIKEAHAEIKDEYLVLSYDPSPWTGEHLFAVTKHVKGEEMTTLSGKFLTKVFEGPYKDAPVWMKKMEQYVTKQGKKVKKQYAFYTSCPKCSKYFGKNYVVMFAEVTQ